MRTVFPDHAEDQLKAEFFGSANSGFFVEVGANDPQRLGARLRKLAADS